MDGDNSPVEDDEFNEFIEQAVKESWNASRTSHELHDISITHDETPREILVNLARNRISYWNTESYEWGLQQKQVNDLSGAVVKLQTVALHVSMNEMHRLGLDGHPAPPEDPSVP